MKAWASYACSQCRQDVGSLISELCWESWITSENYGYKSRAVDRMWKRKIMETKLWLAEIYECVQMYYVFAIMWVHDQYENRGPGSNE